MKRTLFLTMGACVLSGSLAAAAHEETARQLPQDNSMIRVEQVESNDNAVTGRIVNLSDQKIVRVELVAADSFLWRNDHNPGPNDPGGATRFTVSDPIAPHATATFRIPRTLPDRTDGHFVTDVSVVTFTTLEPMAARSSAGIAQQN